jgi:hypothetical protein
MGWRSAPGGLRRTAGQVSAVLRASPAVGAWHGQDLVGFARAVTDGILRAYVEDVVASPDCLFPGGSGVCPASLGRI